MSLSSLAFVPVPDRCSSTFTSLQRTGARRLIKQSINWRSSLSWDSSLTPAASSSNFNGHHMSLSHTFTLTFCHSITVPQSLCHTLLQFTSNHFISVSLTFFYFGTLSLCPCCSVILTFCHSVTIICSFSHSNIDLSFCYLSLSFGYCHSFTLSFCCSYTLQFCRSVALSSCHTVILIFFLLQITQH